MFSLWSTIEVAKFSSSGKHASVTHNANIYLSYQVEGGHVALWRDDAKLEGVGGVRFVGRANGWDKSEDPTTPPFLNFPKPNNFQHEIELRNKTQKEFLKEKTKYRSYRAQAEEKDKLKQPETIAKLTKVRVFIYFMVVM